MRGDGYSLKDLGDHADLIQRELRLLEGVAKVSIGGRVDEQMIVSLDRDRMRALGISPEYLASLLNAQNTVGNAGHLRSEGLSLSVQPTGQLDSVQALEQLAVGSADSGIIRLSDLAEVRRVTNDSPALLYHSDGLPALTIGVSFAEGTNVVDVGDFGIKVRIGDNGPVSIIKKNELALTKSECRVERFARNDRVDAMVTALDLSAYKVSLSIKSLEMSDQKLALEKDKLWKDYLKRVEDLK